MAAAGLVDNRSRIRAAILAGTIEVAAVIALVNGLAASGALPDHNLLTSVFSADPSPSPTPPPPPPPQQHAKASGKAAPPNERSHAAPVIVVPSPLPSLPIPAATRPAVGMAPTNGAADRPGPGSGAGGTGDGTGSGGFGNGEGDGDDGAELVAGRITDGDYPDAAREARAQGTTETEIFVDARGRGTRCRISRSSGNGALDATTCRLALKRFRFRPARDAAGHAIPGSVYFDQKWEIGRIDDQ